MEKRYVMDTNILIHSPSALFEERFSDGVITILLPVVSEIDNLKVNARDPELKFRARRATRYLDDIRKGLIEESPEYVGKFEFKYVKPQGRLESLNKFEVVDDLILEMANELKATVVSGDLNVVLKAEILNMDTIKFDFDSTDFADYKGWRKIKVSQMNLTELTNIESMARIDFYKGLALSVEDRERLTMECEVKSETIKEAYDLCDNEYLIVYTDDCDTNLFFRYKARDDKFVRVKGNRYFDDITSRNTQQRLFMESLQDEDIVCTSAVGCAGSGKSLISISYATEEVINRKNFKKFLYIKPLDVVGGKDIGYLPGSKEEKLEGSTMGSFYDSIEVIYNAKNRAHAKDIAAEMMDRGHLEVESISFLRGRSFNDCILIIDEAQNTDIVTIRTILSRVGQNCKVILLGDISQVDNTKVSHYTNGLYVAKQKLKNSRLYSHVELATSVRSEFAELVNKLLPESGGL